MHGPIPGRNAKTRAAKTKSRFPPSLLSVPTTKLNGIPTLHSQTLAPNLLSDHAMAPHADEDGSGASDADARLFAGVRFALYGFNTLSESQVRTPPPSPRASMRPCADSF